VNNPTVRTFAVLAAAVSMGLVAGVFQVYSHSIMPGLRKTDDRTFVAAFQAIDRKIMNPWFIGATFLGALAFTAVAAIVNRGRPAFWWIAAAFTAYLVVVILTMAVNVPLNDAIKRAGDPSRVDVTIVRAQFHETRWAAANLIRAIASTGAFISLAWALVLSGRATS
jgi:uncharacterized membrane protein